MALLLLSLFAYASHTIAPVHEFEKQRWIDVQDGYGIRNVVLGNSHSRNIYAENADDLYFFSSSGEDMFETLEKTKQVIRTNSGIECIFVNVSPLSGIYSNRYVKEANRVKFL